VLLTPHWWRFSSAASELSSFVAAFSGAIIDEGGGVVAEPLGTGPGPGAMSPAAAAALRSASRSGGAVPSFASIAPSAYTPFSHETVAPVVCAASAPIASAATIATDAAAVRRGHARSGTVMPRAGEGEAGRASSTAA